MPDPIRWQDAWWYQQPDGTWLRFDDATQTWQPIVTRPKVAQTPGMSTGAKVAIALMIALVTFLILAILAAVAIPVFLRQREQAWVSQVESGLKNAAIAQESFCTHAPQCYTTSIEILYQEGLQVPADVQLRVVRADRDDFCIEGHHTMLPNDVWAYDSITGRPREGPCI